MPSPRPSAAGLLPSPHGASAGADTPRPALMKRHSSQQSNTSGKHGITSPSSAGEHHHPLRHHVKPLRKTKIVLPRNNSSARNLNKLARHGSDNHANNAPEALKHSRQKSRDRENEIRLPGSLGDESRPSMRRNLTSQHLPRNTSHTKLKKNLSHGQLARIGSGRNLHGLNSTKGPPSPGLKGKGRKKKSVDQGLPEKDLHEQEMEIERELQQAKEGPRRVGFAVGDGNDSSDDDDDLGMERSGMQEDEWTDQSASASPNTTRQNTANNSRRPSVIADKPPDKSHLRETISAKDMQQPHYPPPPPPPPPPPQPRQQAVVQQPAPEADGTPAASYESDSDSDDEEDPPSPRRALHSHRDTETALPSKSEPSGSQEAPEPQQIAAPQSLLHTAKHQPHPFTKQLLNRNSHYAAPALVSNVSALDDSRRGSPAASMRSSRSNIGEHHPDQEDELVSRFIPSASHPASSSGGNTTVNTPKTGSYQTPENDSTLGAQRREKPVGTSHPPTSPGSTVSGSSGVNTPAMARSRTELRMANERMMAEMEGSGKAQLMIPAHRFDRRNESLKSYLNIASLGGDGRGGLSSTTGLPFGPEIFEGRFKAVNTELKVVQRFRDPWGESVARLKKYRGSTFAQSAAKRGDQKASKMPIGKASTTGDLSRQASKLSSSASPSASLAQDAMMACMSSTNVARGGGSSGASEGRKSGTGRVKFSATPPETREVDRGREELSGADAIARKLWEAASGRP